MLRRFSIHPNAYYNHCKGKKTIYHEQRKKACAAIKKIYHETEGVLGHRNMIIFLKREGIVLSKTTIHKYMNKELGLKSICRRKKSAYKKGYAHRIFPNLIDRNFRTDRINHIWCSDFTYINLSNGVTRYNCSIIDLYDRSIVSSVNGKWINTALALKALDKALKSQGPINGELILHTDQGSQFTSLEFIEYCRKNNIIQSMSRAGCPYDNAPMERFYNTMKSELVYQYHFRNDDELDSAIYEFSYGWYNMVRPHSFNGYLTPYEARQNLGQIR